MQQERYPLQTGEKKTHSYPLTIHFNHPEPATEFRSLNYIFLCSLGSNLPVFLDASAAAPGTTATLSLVPGRRGNRGQAGSLSPTPHPALPAHTAKLCKQDGWVWKACHAPKLLISTAWWAPHQPASARGCVCHEMGTKKAQLRLKIPSLLLNREISL